MIRSKYINFDLNSDRQSGCLLNFLSRKLVQQVAAAAKKKLKSADPKCVILVESVDILLKFKKRRDQIGLMCSCYITLFSLF